MEKGAGQGILSDKYCSFSVLWITPTPTQGLRDPWVIARVEGGDTGGLAPEGETYKRQGEVWGCGVGGER